MITSEIRTTAQKLLDAYDRGALIPPPSEQHPQFDWKSAYKVAAAMVEMRRARGEKPVGRKIGFTNRNIWAEYGATSPIWAHVYDSTLVYAKNNHAAISLRGSAAPRLEPEIAFKLRAPVPVACKDPATILQAVEWLAPSFEIVDCHFLNWKFKSADSAADLSFHWRLVVGDPYRIGGADQHRSPRKSAIAKSRCRAMARCATAASAAMRSIIRRSRSHFWRTSWRRNRNFPARRRRSDHHRHVDRGAADRRGETWTSEISGLPVAPLTVTFGS